MTNMIRAYEIKNRKNENISLEFPDIGILVEENMGKRPIVSKYNSKQNEINGISLTRIDKEIKQKGFYQDKDFTIKEIKDPTHVERLKKHAESLYRKPKLQINL